MHINHERVLSFPKGMYELGFSYIVWNNRACGLEAVLKIYKPVNEGIISKTNMACDFCDCPRKAILKGDGVK